MSADERPAGAGAAPDAGATGARGPGADRPGGDAAIRACSGLTAAEGRSGEPGATGAIRVTGGGGAAAAADAPYAGLRVLDLSEGVAGPFCTKLLAGLGADVITVEAPGRGDCARAQPPFPGDDPHPETGGLFLYLNTGKRSVTLDLAQASGRAILRRLVPRADLVVEGFAPAVSGARGLGYGALDALRPGIVLVSVTDFGQNGPYRDLPATDLTALALGGSLYISGDEDREPVAIGGRPAQFFAGLSAFAGAAAAIHCRDASGEGQHVDVSMHEGIATAQEYPGTAWAYQREIRRRGPGHAPMFEVDDGYLGLMFPQAAWPRFCELIGRPGLERDPRFATARLRRDHMDELRPYVEEWTRGRRKADLYHEAQGARVPAGYVCDAPALLESAQYRERGFFAAIDHPVAGRLRYPGLPLRIGGTPPPRRAPLLGEHNAEVYGGLLGCTARDLARMRGAGVI